MFIQSTGEELTAQPLFEQDQDEITVQFVSDGLLQITIGRKLSHGQIRAFERGTYNNVRGIRHCHLDPRAAHQTDTTTFVVSLKPGMAGTQIPITREAIRLYAASYLRNLEPEPVQQSMF